MSERKGPGYGTPNWEMISRWLELPPDEDGPFWALNLMRYREVADYGDGRESRVSGQEADDAYAPLGPLAAIGAMVAFHADVDAQSLGEPGWHRIGIVRYPSRSAFFAMQQREDFKDQHVHKEAGMEFTIVMACHPASVDESAGPDGSLVLTVARSGSAAEPEPLPTGVCPVATFAVEGVIVGDERTFDQVRFDRVTDDESLRALEAWAGSNTEAHQMVVEPLLDELVGSIVSGPGAPRRPQGGATHIDPQGAAT